MPDITFIAQRISRKENLLFPDKIIIGDSNVAFYKGHIVGYQKIIINKSILSSVTIRENILFADIVIDSRGTHKIMGCGFSKSDARKIVDLLT